MSSMPAAPKSKRLAADADLPEVIEVVNELADAAQTADWHSPSVPLDAEHPSASITYSDEAYDDLRRRLDAPPAPNEALRRTMLGADNSEQ